MNLTISNVSAETATAIKALVESTFKDVTCEFESNESIEATDGIEIYD